MGYKAWLVESPDGPFLERDSPHLVLAANQVLVRFAASGVNPLDTKIRAAKATHARQPLPAVLGVDMAGTVEAVGPGVTALKPGDEVYGMVGGVGGNQGTLAEKIVADADLLAHKPKNLAMRQAAALPLSVITAWEGLVDRAKIHSRQQVLIHAGAGGVGHIAVQIARAFGADVFATVSPDKAKIVADFGATPIDYRSMSVDRYVAAHIGGRGFDIVYDTVGGATLDASFTAVRRYTGHALSCLGWGSHPGSPVLPRSHLLRSLHLAPAAHRRRPRPPRRDTHPGRRPRRGRQAPPASRRAHLLHCRDRCRAHTGRLRLARQGRHRSLNLNKRPESLNDALRQRLSILLGRQLVSRARNRNQLRSRRDELQRRFHLRDRAESVSCAADEQRRRLEARKVRRTQLIRPLRRMQRVGKQQECLGNPWLSRSEHRRLPASIGMPAQKHPASHPAPH